MALHSQPLSLINIHSGFLPTESDCCRAGASYHTDLPSMVVNKEIVSSAPLKDYWQEVEYATHRLSGRMIFINENSAPPPVTLDLPLTGWHAVSLGIVSYKTDQSLWARLCGDGSFRRFSPVCKGYVPGDYIVECFFDYYDFSKGIQIQISQDKIRQSGSIGLAFVRTIPLSADEVDQLCACRQDARNRRVLCKIDGDCLLADWNPDDESVPAEEVIASRVEDFAQSDCGMFMLTTGLADACCYESQVGERLGSYPNVDWSQNFRFSHLEKEGVRLGALHYKGIDPLKIIRQRCRELDMEFHVSLRMAAWRAQFPDEAFFRSRFYDENPQWHCVDADGTEVARMSYAFPQVRERLLSHLAEIAAYAPDGVNFGFNRGVPLMLFEEPILSEFERRYGQDARTVSLYDGRLLDIRCAILTDFMRDARRVLDDASRDNGCPRIKISAYTFPMEGLNRFYGLDIGQWVRDGLIDILMPFPWEHTYGPSSKQIFGVGITEAMIDILYYMQITDGTPVEVYPTIVAWRSDEPQKYVDYAGEFYKRGCHGVAIWDADYVAARSWEWSVVRNLGHRNTIMALAEEEYSLPPSPTQHRIVNYNGVRLDTIHHCLIGL